MSRDDGFAVADVDSGYFADAKLTDLWHRLNDADRMARAVCIHKATLLASWRLGERVTASQACPLWLPPEPDLIAALRAAKLLDRTGRIPEQSFIEWFGTAYARRELRREAGRTGGRASVAGRSARAQRMPKQPLTDAQPNAEPVRPSVPTDRPDDARADLDAFLEVKFRAPTPAQRTFLDGYCRTFDATGPERAARLILSNPDDPIGALKADLAAFRADRRAKAEAEPVPAPRKRAAGLTGINAELAAAFGERYATEDPKWEAAHHAALVGKAP